MTKQRKPIKPIYLQVRKMIDPETGEEIGALVPRGGVDRRIMREREYRNGDYLRAALSKPRNVKIHRMVHALGGLIADHIEDFTGMDSHAVIKRLQRESGIMCEEQEIDIPGIGKLVVKVAMSLAFDEMDESEFRTLWRGICDHTIKKYWPDMTEDGIDSMIDLMPQ